MSTGVVFDGGRACAGGTELMTARVAGDLSLPEVDLHQALNGMGVRSFAHIMMQHQVVMLLEIDVVIDIDPAAPDLDVLIRMFG